jgi:glycosyltransferase involved in cell wall biosynthesis
MTCGLPVIVSDVCGCVDDLVLPERNGIIFPVDNAAKLAEAMLQLAKQEERRVSMGTESEVLIRPWTIERQAETIRAALVRMSYTR